MTTEMDRDEKQFAITELISMEMGLDELPGYSNEYDSIKKAIEKTIEDLKK